VPSWQWVESSPYLHVAHSLHQVANCYNHQLKSLWTNGCQKRQLLQCTSECSNRYMCVCVQPVTILYTHLSEDINSTRTFKLKLHVTFLYLSRVSFVPQYVNQRSHGKYFQNLLYLKLGLINAKNHYSQFLCASHETNRKIYTERLQKKPRHSKWTEDRISIHHSFGLEKEMVCYTKKMKTQTPHFNDYEGLWRQLKSLIWQARPNGLTNADH
jgi:hypothetical protein